MPLKYNRSIDVHLCKIGGIKFGKGEHTCLPYRLHVYVERFMAHHVLEYLFYPRQ